MRNFFFATVLAALAAGCTISSTDAAPEATAQATVNDHCPIMGGDVTSKGGTAEWNGKTIGFCCPGCAPKWEALSDEQKAEKLAAADSAEGDHDLDHS